MTVHAAFEATPLIMVAEFPAFFPAAATDEIAAALLAIKTVIV